MSGPPQTPTRFPPNQQFAARPGMPGHMALGTPTQQQRPAMMQFRPGMQMSPQQQQQQQQMYLAAAANRGMAVGNMTPQMQAQYNQQLQQQYLHQQQMNGQMRPTMPNMQGSPAGVRPGAAMQQQQQQAMYAGNAGMVSAGVAMHGQQPHPALIQPHTPTQAARKRKGRPSNDIAPGAAGDGGAGSGDELDNLQPHNISLARYQNSHNLMSEVFVALPTSTISLPKHYYEDLEKDAVSGELDALSSSLERCESEHASRMQDIQKSRDGFAEIIKTLVSAKDEDVDAIKRELESQFAMEFVNNPYRTVERIPIDRIEPVENAVYKQL
ncbi:hypothetical protein H4R26_000368 [Coemansia thaxteri]|uniref:SWI/SNF and RSC complexes subunit Ssr4 C-terminal domain-containing protein n=1 Tax=Coemansia thaxteri TaxID=2663907 RepID=A0A9W8BP08_9FUNG|nr:hypothetical protein H4R26_000368 [Coemansia thaxteri]KAJ2486311.1 hypothetical protein EV174_001182 [Coemansia sp. RSA 2320]